MIFASTYPVSDDPTPYKNFPYDGPRTAQPGTVFSYSPRPEFDRPRAHQANPLLLTMHLLHGQFDGRGRFSKREHLKFLIQQARLDMERPMLDTPERDHARKVLDRLDRMNGRVTEIAADTRTTAQATPVVSSTEAESESPNA